MTKKLINQGQLRKISRKTVYFLGLLANVDSSILRMRLDHGFKVEGMSSDEGQQLISALESLPYLVVLEKLARLQCLNSSEDGVYFVSNRFESDIKITDTGILIGLPPELVDFNNKLLEGYLNPLIRLMNLFKEGNIRMPATYYYIDKASPRSFLLGRTGLFVTPGSYTLKSSEVPELLTFVDRQVKLTRLRH